MGAVSIVAGQTARRSCSGCGQPRLRRAGEPADAQAPAIRFEDASDKADIDFAHSFGSAKLGSLLEGTGAGCVWFDYNNDGLPISMW